MGKNKKKKSNVSYVAGITVLTFVLAVLMQSFSDFLFSRIFIIYGFFILMAVISIGIIFDIIGVAVTSVSETSFHAMASGKVKGAKESLYLIKNSEKVSNVCNDVIGDVCGIVSGSITTFIAAKIIFSGDMADVLFSMFLTGLVSAVTVGGKAMGKTVAISKNKEIVYLAGKFISFFKR